MTQEKGRLSLRGLDEEVIETFRERVRERYGKLHTVFAQEVQKAMEQYLDPANTHTQEKFVQREKKSIGAIRLEEAEQEIQKVGLLAAINKGGVYPKAIKKVMEQSVGLDNRTINKYFDLFCEKHSLTIEQSGALGCL